MAGVVLSWIYAGTTPDTTPQDGESLITAYIVLAFEDIFLATEQLDSYRYRYPIFPIQGRGSEIPANKAEQVQIDDTIILSGQSETNVAGFIPDEALAES